MIEEILKVLPKYISSEIVRINCAQNITEIRLRSRSKAILRCINTEIILECIVTTKSILEVLLNVSKNLSYPLLSVSPYEINIPININIIKLAIALTIFIKKSPLKLSFHT